MIIVIMLMNMGMKMSNVWSARLSHSLWKCAAPPTHLRIKIRRPSQTNLSAAGKIRLLLRLKWHSCGALNGTHSIWVTTQFSYVYLHICSIYILSMGKTWSDLFKIMCCIVLLLPPIKPNGPSCLSYLPKHIPPQPNPTQLKYSPPHLYKYDSWLRNRAQTAPPDCSQTQLKSDHLSHLRQTQSTFHRTTTS